MNKEISFLALWDVLKSSWKVIIIFTLLVAILVGLGTQFLTQKQYSSSVTFYVINTSSGSEYTTTSLLSAVEQLANDYIQIITSDVLLVELVDDIKEQEGLSYSVKQVRRMISANITADTSMFTITVTNPDPEHAYIIAKYINDEAPDVIKNIVKPWLIKVTDESSPVEVNVTECVTPITYPAQAKTHNSTGMVKNIAIASFVTFIMLYVICLIRSMFNTIIKTEEDIKAVTDKYPLIGVIPSWNKK